MWLFPAMAKKNLYNLLKEFLEAYGRRTEAMSGSVSDNSEEVLSAIGEVNNRLDFLAKEVTGATQRLDMIIGALEGDVTTAINNLNGKADTMSSNIDRIEKEAADAAENVGLVRTALETLNTTVSDLKTVVADLQTQVAQGQVDQARLDAAASTLEKADDDLDALVLPAPASDTGRSEGDGTETPTEDGGTPA